MRGVPGWQLTLCIVTTLLRGAESIRMIYRARAGTFFCIFFVFLARVSVGLRSMLWGWGIILPNKKVKRESWEREFSPKNHDLEHRLRKNKTSVFVMKQFTHKPFHTNHNSLILLYITERSIMRPSAARTSSSPHNNIHPLLTDDDSDDENKRLDAELHKDLVNSLRDTVSAFGDSNFTLLWRVEYSRRVCAQIMLCLLSFLLRADSKLTDDTRVFLYHILSKQHRECTTLRRVWHLAPVLLSQQQQQRRRRRRRRRTRSLYIVPFERDGGGRQSE